MKTETIRFTRIVLKNWKNFVDADVNLARRMFLVGPNAVGKSNFLDAFRFMRDLSIEGGGLAKAVEWRNGMTGVRSLFARQDPSVRIAVTMAPESGVEFTYDLSFKQRSKNDATPVVVRERVTRRDTAGETEIKLRDEKTESDKGVLTQTALQQVSENRGFRNLVAFFSSVSYLHLVPQLLREEQEPHRLGSAPDHYGRDLLVQIRDTQKKMRNARLKRIGDVLKKVVSHLADLEFVEDERTRRPHLRARYEHWRPHGAYQDERQFSDGTLRLIGLLWSLQDKAAPLLLEEPELSLNTAIVRQLAPFIHRAQRDGGGRQVLLSTHSEQILEDDGISPEEILLVKPASEGSEIVSGANHSEIAELMRNGVLAGEAVRSRGGSQLSLFDEGAA
jgi:predicted ATPase